MIRTWRLDDARQSMVLASENDRLPGVIYWGARLPDGEDLDTLFAAQVPDVTGGMLDQNPDLSICPEASQTFPGHPGCEARRLNGTPLHPKLRFDQAEGADHTLTLTYRDAPNGLTYRATFEIDPATHMITTRAELLSNDPLVLHWLSAPAIPAPQQGAEMIDFSGRWCGEVHLSRIPWTPGIHMRENRTGRTGHEHFPGVILPGQGTTNTSGEAWAVHLGWSGGHRMIAEELPDGRRQIQFGIAANLVTKPTTRIETPPLYLTYSGSGLNGCATAFQRQLRDRSVTWPPPDRPHPVHYNCWEAVYFDHKLDELKQIATKAADLGAERFVLDDGWFGKRDDDTQSLGDWQVDPRKYPDGLHPLIDHIHGLGMTFGLWFEPEMINANSDLYRTHPDWVLGDRDQITGRQQYVLDMARADVRDTLYDQIAAILTAHDIDYIKWDHNRVLPSPDHTQTQGIYDLLNRLRSNFPHVEIESCSSGGGRIDFGILSHTQRVWLSDSNDALERLRIQHNAALFLPAAVTGSHVGPRTCHTSGRVLDIRFRAWVAAQRHMGFEMDPRELTDDETEVLKHVTGWWRANRDWMMGADILRLDPSDPAVIAEQQMTADGDRFVVFAGKADTSKHILPRPLCLTGLDPAQTYEIKLINRDDTPALSRGNPLLKSRSARLSGAFLMHHGLTLPWDFPERMWVIEGTRL
jgi:alpha-galactosidase